MISARDLKYRSVREAASDLRILKNVTFRPESGWTLYQVVRHLSEFIDSSMTGFSFQHPWLIRRTIGRLFLMYYRENGYPSHPAVHPPHHPAGGDTDAALDELDRITERFEYHEGSLAEHPFYGRMTYEEWHLWHLWHIEKHMSLLNPAESEPDQVSVITKLPAIPAKKKASKKRPSSRKKAR